MARTIESPRTTSSLGPLHRTPLCAHRMILTLEERLATRAWGMSGPVVRIQEQTEQNRQVLSALPLALPLRSGKAEGLKLTYPIHHRAPCPVARLSSHTSQSRRGGDSPRTGVDQSHTYMRAGQRAGIQTSVKRRPAGPHPTESPRTTCLLTLVLFVEASRDLRSGCST